jgi:nicotinate-nucleotide adenylyltransferase
MKVGILGGTFDPVHLGHLAAAKEVKAGLRLDEVLFVPAGRPWLKGDAGVLGAEHRLAMLRLALGGRPDFKIDTIELDRPGPTYTVDTLAKLRRHSPDDELFFIIGADNLAQLPRWRESERIISLCRLVVVPRVGCPPPDIDRLEADIPGLKQRLVILDKPLIDISASMIRERVRQGLPIDNLVPEALAGYIKEKGLYRAG